MKGLSIFDLENGLYAAPIADLQTPGIEYLDQYAEMLIGIHLSDVVKQKCT